MYHTIYHAPTGPLHLIADDHQLLHVTPKFTPVDGIHGGVNHVLGKTVQELDAYFAGKLTTFTVPYRRPTKDTFTADAQRALTTIPYGQTRTYQQVAAKLDKPGATRAVGTACATNPLLIIVPCHRVVRADGQPGQYAGGAAMKQYLLHLEQV